MSIKFLRALPFLACGALLLVHATGARAQSGKILGAYFEEWSIYGADYNISDVQNSGAASKLTHVFYAFANVTTSGQCGIADAWADYQTPYLPSVNGQPYTGPLYGNFAALQQLKQLHPGLKILISIGGASATNTAAFSAAAATAEGRVSLANSCINMFIKGNVAQGISTGSLFDGIDIDWEFPTAADKPNYVALMAEFRNLLNTLGTQTNKHYLLTIAAPAGSQNYSNMAISTVQSDLDFLNLETYDYHGTWETTTNHAAPLLDSPYDPDFGQHLDVNDTISDYLNMQVPAEKLVLGIPFYGRGWTGVPSAMFGLYQTSTGPAPSPAGDTLATDGLATFRTLEALNGHDGYTLHRDFQSYADWLYNPDAQVFWSYDDVPTVVYKSAVAKLRTAGAFGWALKDDDANATLVNTIAAGLGIQNH